MEKEYFYCEKCNIFTTENLNICPVCKNKTSAKKISPFDKDKSTKDKDNKNEY